ncbi:MAG: response regulator [Candidatus Tectimicrobiota bacterium]
MAKKLLLIEDSLSIQALVASTFAHEDFDLIVTDNAADGLHKAQTMLPDLVLADASMPEMDGFQLCQRIRQSPDGRHIPVVLLTSNFAVYDAAKGDLAGVTTHLAKPFAAHALVDLVNQCLPLVRRTSQTPQAPVLSAAPATENGHAIEPDLASVPTPQIPGPLLLETEQWTDTGVELGLEMPISTVLQELMADTADASSESPHAPEDAPAPQPAPFSALPPPVPASAATDEASLAFYQALGSRFEHLLRETFESHVRSALEQLMPQLLTAAHTVIAEQMPALLTELLRQEIDKLKRAVEREPDYGAPH